MHCSMVRYEAACVSEYSLEQVRCPVFSTDTRVTLDNSFSN